MTMKPGAQPPRWRNNSSLRAGIPGACAAKTEEGEAPARQRVSAALGTGAAPALTMNTQFRRARAAIASRRVATRS